MLVDSRASTALGAARVTGQPLPAAWLLAGMTSIPTLNDALWSNSAERHAERLEGLQKDEDRVDGVLEGLAPTGAEQVAQARAARNDAVQSASSRAQRREATRQEAGLARGGFRSVLFGARGASTPAKLPSAIGSAAPALSTGEPVQSAPSPISQSAAVAAGAPDLPPQPDAPLPVSDAQKPAPALVQPTVPPPPGGNLPAAGSQPTASSPVAPLPPITAATQSAAPAATSTGPSSSGVASSSTAITSGSADGAGKSDCAATQAAERDAQETKPDPDERAENVERVLRVLRGSLRRERTTTVIRLDPPELGALRLELDLHKEVLTLRMSAETAAAQDLLRDELDVLRRGLETAGIRLERVEIQPLVPAHEAAPFSAFADLGRRRGDSSGDSSGRGAGPAPAGRVNRPIAEAQGTAVPQPPLAIGAARLNIVA